ncbi:hypothetical protein SLEP1_g25926 [Rubroshorea leprosula]|uniref:Pentatricopeptide repeat-containing protein n=1 Tax=Rubroshorea leprosula TaxID=152421 RepID=A0AAV5JKP3_9ROSI|nr:hypothetical protein SLEP1_g25926 [Rubroshorea leprosula]
MDSPLWLEYRKLVLTSRGNSGCLSFSSKFSLNLPSSYHQKCNRGLTPDIVTYNTLINGLCRAGDALINLFNFILYSTACSANAGLADEEPDCVLVPFTELKVPANPALAGREPSKAGFQPNPALLGFQSSLAGFVETQPWLVDEPSKARFPSNSKERKRKEEGEERDWEGECECECEDEGYNSLTSTLCKNRKVHEAKEMFGEMKNKGFKPDTFAFNSPIFGLCKVNEMEEALTVYHDMLVEGVVANTVTYNTLIHAFLWTGAIQEALKQAC